MPGSAAETDAAGYRPLLFSIAYGMTGSVGDAEDIVQDAFLGMLAPGVVLHADGGGKTQAIGKPLTGREPVTRLLVSLLRRARLLGASLRPAWVNGQPGTVMYDAEGRVVSVIELDVAGGVVQAMYAVVNPDKLGHLGPVSDVARLPDGHVHHEEGYR